MVATTFAADTPLVVSGLIRGGGIYKNWLWWNAFMAGILTVFFYARLWRRAGILTDVEFAELRYGGKAAAGLRGFGAIVGGLITNCIVLGWVILAMAKICEVMLGWPKVTSITVLTVATLGYTVLSGFWGVVMTDFIQFIMAMTGSISLGRHRALEDGRAGLELGRQSPGDGRASARRSSVSSPIWPRRGNSR